MKEQLVQLIEAFAAARGSGNATLQQFSAQQLSAFLDQIEVTQKAPADETDGDEG
jgi:hypothetical protein